MSVSELSGKVQTVLGPVSPQSLGITLMHEHLVVDLECNFQQPDEASERAWVHAPISMDRLGGLVRRSYYNLDTIRMWDTDAAINEVLLYKYAGGSSLVDTTSIGIGRDPLALAHISRATGLNIVMGGSYYVPSSHPSDMHEKSEDEITAEIIRDITVGVGETGVRMGIIGEVGMSWPLTDNLRKVLRASARAQAETGAPITIHPGAQDLATHGILDVLVAAGAEPERTIMGHLGLSVTDRAALKSLAETGCFLEYDHLGTFEDTSKTYPRRDYVVSDVQEMEKLEFLIGEGHLDQVLIAHDVCYKYHHTRYGGKGFAHILDNIVPRMRKRGFTDDQINAMLVDNPRRALTFR